MAMQITALAAMIRNPMTGIKFQTACNSYHNGYPSIRRASMRSGDIQVFVRLHRQPPARMSLAPVDCQTRIHVT